MLLYSYAQFAVINDRVVTARGDLNSLQTEYAALSAQYEQAFDVQHIQDTVGDEMVRPSQDQVVYLDLSEPDAVTVYQQSESGGLSGLLAKLGALAGDVIEYFR